MTIHCRVISFLTADTLRVLVTLTFDLLTLNSCHKCHMSNPATKFGLQKLSIYIITVILSWVILSLDTIDIAFLATAHASFSLMSINCIGLHKMSIYKITVICFFAWPHLRPFSATLLLRMRTNGYLWTSGVNSDSAVRFADPDFLLECKITAIWRRFPLIFLHFICWMSVVFLLPVYLTYWPRKFEDHTPIRSWVMSYNVSRWLPLKMRTWPVIWGQKTITFLECPTPICLFTIQLLLGYDDD